MEINKLYDIGYTRFNEILIDLSISLNLVSIYCVNNIFLNSGSGVEKVYRVSLLSLIT